MFPMVRPAITQKGRREREREQEDERQHCYHPFNHGLCCLNVLFLEEDFSKAASFEELRFRKRRRGGGMLHAMYRTFEIIGLSISWYIYMI